MIGKRCIYNRLFVAVILATVAGRVSAALQTESVVYEHNGVTLEGHLTYDDQFEGKRPGVLVVHEWWGLNDYARTRAEQLAGLGYVAFAVDMYGQGKLTEHPEQAMEWSGQLSDTQLMRDRAATGLRVLAGHEWVDGNRIAAIGYCFGASTVTQLAYSGADVKAVVSFHGSLPTPTPADVDRIKAKILICHGAEDGFVPQARITAFKETLRGSGVDWQLIQYGGALHSFTVPGSEERGMQGLAYHADADRRSWQDMLRLFDEVFR